MDEGERKRKLEYIQFEAGEIEGARLVPVINSIHGSAIYYSSGYDDLSIL